MRTISLGLSVLGLIISSTSARAQDVNDKAEAAIKAAVARVAPSVVRIETSGGAEVVGLTPGGRALGVDENAPPSVSVGIVSALGRMYGKAVQTDAKVSPVNYGGPLVGIDGRVQGVLVPASPRGDSDAAGVEWYDSGIGFAIP